MGDPPLMEPPRRSGQLERDPGPRRSRRWKLRRVKRQREADMFIFRGSVALTFLVGQIWWNMIEHVYVWQIQNASSSKWILPRLDCDLGMVYGIGCHMKLRQLTEVMPM